MTNPKGVTASPEERDPRMTRMTLCEIRWFGALGFVLACLGSLYMALDHHGGWKMWADLLCAIYWTFLAARFLRLKTIVIECDAVAVVKHYQGDQ